MLLAMVWQEPYVMTVLKPLDPAERQRGRAQRRNAAKREKRRLQREEGRANPQPIPISLVTGR